MSSFLQPDPIILFFLFAKKFLYLEILAILALLRMFAGIGRARWPALAALILCCLGIATVFAPALGVAEGQAYVFAARAMADSGGMAVLLVASALMFISAITPGARWRWIDIVHVALFLGLLGLWFWTA